MSFTDIKRARARKNSTGRIQNKLSSYQIILAPLFTEKTVKDNEVNGVFSFKVHKDANKIDVKNAIKDIYDVDVSSVRIMRVGAKGRANRKCVRKAYKKAMVALEWDKTIELV